MRRGEKRLFLGVLGILALALVLLLVQWVRGGNAPQVHHVSVLLDGADGDYWKNFRAGMNQAALEYNVDLRILSKYDGEAAQADVLRAEWEGEADGVVLIPGDGAALGEILKEAPDRLVVGVVGPELGTGGVDCYVSPDYAAMGRRLADAAIGAGGDRGCTIYLSPAAGETARRLAGELTALLGEEQIDCRLVAVDPQALSAPAKAGALVAVEPAMAEALCTAEDAWGRVVGVGSSSRLLHYLEDGTAAARVVQSDYDAGYCAIAQVAARLSRQGGAAPLLESYTATAENMFTQPMINILFPAY